MIDSDSVNGLSTKGLGTLRTALLLSAPGPLLTGLAVIMSFSPTQSADFLRRTAELAAIFASWWIYRRLLKDKELTAVRRERLERLANTMVGSSMVCTGCIMLLIAAFHQFAYKTGGNVMVGLVTAVLGLIANTVFWLRYRSLTRDRMDRVLTAQKKLYRAKAVVDFCVVLALTSVALAPAHPVTKYIDILGSGVVAVYLVWNGLDVLRTKSLRQR